MSPPDAALARFGLGGVLLAALTVRLWLLATHTYVVWPDETFQYLEPAHRLVFGAGVITWEYLDGIRSWLLPGLIACVMWLASWVSSDPDVYVGALRLLCVLASLSVPFVGFRLVERRCGLRAAVLSGLLSGLATESVYFSPAVMTEPLATYAALLAIWLGDGAVPQPPRRLLLAGLLFGLACSLRYQYAPVLGLVALWQHARDRRGLAIVATAGIAVVVLALGVLDTITWGLPFQSVWLNYSRNVLEGVSGAMGEQPWWFYAGYYLAAWGTISLAFLLVAVIGALRVPLLAVVVIATIGLHSLAQHKEPRFVFLASACLPMLVGAGLGTALQRRWQARATSSLASLAEPAVIGLVLSATTAVTTVGRSMPPDAWHRERSILQATAAARALPQACGLGLRAWLYETGGYSYWHRAAPIYFETWDEAQDLPGSSFRLRLASVRDGRPVPQYPGPALATATQRFNVLIAAPDAGFPGFARDDCFGEGTIDDKRFCVFTRAGGCD